MRNHPRIRDWNAEIQTGLCVLLDVFLPLAGCGPSEPVRIGFVGGVSGHAAGLVAQVHGESGAVATGDARRQNFITVVRGGQFVAVE